MWKYIVTWFVVMTVYTTVSQQDEFGRYTGSYYESENVYQPNTRWFNDRDSAFDFYYRASSMQADTMNIDGVEYMIYGTGGRLIDVKIDSSWISQPSE